MPPTAEQLMEAIDHFFEADLAVLDWTYRAAPLKPGASIKNKMKPLIATRKIHNRINTYLPDAVDKACLADQSALKGRTVGEQFAHIHMCG